ncbi:NADH-quinone oxidoreductase subunit NuoI [Aliarcobacter cibarius]|jgi:NADH-quinone oxidoreductase subunit I|nr:NADH-quinone oxidoreductase subunit NuoI [Aliarcobacter cibarius]QEZ88294.1 NADH:quinone oxidoreductase I, chain I [Aliarcobacter cibarius]QKJ26325.1 NADH:quinone oxidoreductase I, chain I [Aliarcobacter cibarius]
MNEKNYKIVVEDDYPKSNWDIFKQIIKRSLKGELLVGLKITIGIFYRTLFKNESATVHYPKEKLPLSPRYRAVHKLLRLLESENERCIGCGLCEKICISKCIKMDTRIDENSRKEVLEYTINMGRCIFCGYCAEVCPELAIVHGQRYENASEQRAHFTLKEDILTPKNSLKWQIEYDGFGSVSKDADKKIKKTPLSY